MKYKSRIIIICFVLIILNATLVSGKHDPKFTNSRSYSLAYPSFDYNNFNISTYYSGDHGYGVYIGDSINIHLPIVINYKIKFINYKVGTYGVYTNIGLTGVSSFMIDSNTDNYASSSAPPCFSLGIGRSAPYIHFSDKTFYTVKLFIYPTN